MALEQKIRQYMLRAERREEQLMKAEREKTARTKQLQHELLEQYKQSEQLADQVRDAQDECRILKSRLAKQD